MTAVSDALAERLVRHVVLAFDPTVAAAAVDYWKESRPHYESMVAHVCDLVAGTEVEPALARLTEQPGDLTAEKPLRVGLAELLASQPDRHGHLAAELDLAAAAIRIDYHHGESHRPEAVPADLSRLLEWSANRMANPARDPDVVVVIPFRDDAGGGRVRNLLACLLALRDQTRPPMITVVETDTVSRWRDVVEPLVDRYVFASHLGPFNKSWTVNLGVAHGCGQARALCVLDADILADHDFVARNAKRLRHGGQHAAHLPYLDALMLDPAASHRAIWDRVAEGEPEVPLDGLRGLVIKSPPGGCVWLTRDAFDRVGGMDERYVGWGGEDDDMLARLLRHGPVKRFSDPFLHLNHPRQRMVTESGVMLNAYLEPMSWRPEYGYGRLAGAWPAEDGVQ